MMLEEKFEGKVEHNTIDRSKSEGKLRGLRNIPCGNTVFLVDGPVKMPSNYKITTHVLNNNTTPKVLHTDLNSKKGRFEHSPEVHRKHVMDAQ